MSSNLRRHNLLCYFLRVWCPDLCFNEVMCVHFIYCTEIMSHIIFVLKIGVLFFLVCYFFVMLAYQTCKAKFFFLLQKIWTFMKIMIAKFSMCKIFSNAWFLFLVNFLTENSFQKVFLPSFFIFMCICCQILKKFVSSCKYFYLRIWSCH